jgi:hypothetical protein
VLQLDDYFNIFIMAGRRTVAAFGAKAEQKILGDPTQPTLHGTGVTQRVTHR